MGRCYGEFQPAGGGGDASAEPRESGTLVRVTERGQAKAAPTTGPAVLLTRLVALTRSIIRNEDILARFGGEEFTIILKGTPSEGAVTLTERLRKLIDESPFEFEGKRKEAVRLCCL